MKKISSLLVMISMLMPTVSNAVFATTIVDSGNANPTEVLRSSPVEEDANLVSDPTMDNSGESAAPDNLIATPFAATGMVQPFAATTGPASLTVTDKETGQPVAGIQYSLTKINEDGRIDELGNFTTDTEGKISWDLPFGNYILRLVRGQAYAFYPEKTTGDEPGTIEFFVSETNAYNTNLTGQVSKQKEYPVYILNDQGELLVDPATIHIFGDDGSDLTLQYQPGQVPIFTETIGVKYTVTQDQVDGYMSPNPSEIPLDTLDTLASIQFIHFKDAPKGAGIRIQKIDQDTGDALSGAEFAVYKMGWNYTDPEMEYQGQWYTYVTSITTDTSGSASYTLPDGDIIQDYVYKEVTAPTGYKLDNRVYPAEEVTQIVSNVKLVEGSTFTFQKLDAQTGLGLPGAEFKIYESDPNGAEIIQGQKYSELRTHTSGPDGKFTVELPDSSKQYVYLETVVSDGYMTMDQGGIPDYHVIDYNDKAPIIYNTKEAGGFSEIEAYGADFDPMDQYPLAGVRFEIFDQDGNVIATTEATGADGKVKTPFIPAGSYRVRKLSR